MIKLFRQLQPARRLWRWLQSRCQLWWWQWELHVEGAGENDSTLHLDSPKEIPTHVIVFSNQDTGSGSIAFCPPALAR